MEHVQYYPGSDAKGSFRIMEGGKVLGRLEVGIADGRLTAYHTEVAPEAEGKGLGRQLVDAMIAHAREHQLQVKPICPYVQAQFKRRAADLADIWKPQDA